MDHLITFSFNAEKRTLTAIYMAQAQEPEGIDEAIVKDAMHSEGYEEYRIDETSMHVLLKAIGKNEACKVILAHQEDASISLRVSEDNVKVFAEVHHARGGRALTLADIEDELRQANIQLPPIDKAIEEILRVQSAHGILLVQGKPMTPGRYAYFKTLVESLQDVSLSEDEQGTIDFKNLQKFVIVDADEPLMRRVPAKPGVDGIDVYGEIIEALDGKDEIFKSELQGAKISDADEDVLVSCIKGHPVVEHGNVRVEKTIVLDNVDLSSGNVEFDGSVYIKGIVDTGMRVLATGDITVDGTVRRSNIEAGHSITVGQGIIGGEAKKSEENPGKEEKGAHIVCGGDLTSKFIDDSKVIVGKNAYIRDHVSNCEMQVNRKLLVGMESGKGCIVGGECYAADSISARVAGTMANVKTTLKTGMSEDMQHICDNKYQEMKEKEEVLTSLSDALIKIGKHEGTGNLNDKLQQTLVSLVKTLQALVPEIKRVSEELHQLQSHALELGESSYIKILGTAHAGTEIWVNNEYKSIDTDSHHAMYQLNSDKALVITHEFDKDKEENPKSE